MIKPSRMDWTLLKLSVAKKNRELFAQLDGYLEERASDFLHQLKHDVDGCSDPKSFYEKEIPYRMGSLATTDLRHITKVITSGYTQNLYWLKSSLAAFGIRKFELPFVDYPLRTEDFETSELDLMDIHKTRLYTRVGTIVTALCLSSFGVGVFVGSILFGTGAEEIFISRTKRSKEKIMAILPDIVNNYKLQLKLHVMEAMTQPNAAIINALNKISYGECH